MNCKSQFLKVDVTAAKIHSNFFLIGVGGFLKIYNKRTSKAVTQVNVFEDQKIYGIVVNKSKDKILLYGGRYMKSFAVNSSLTCVDEISHTVAPDWILNAKWIDDDREIVTVSMHNKLHIWSCDLKLINELECQEKCILYSAYICYEKIDELVILCGTVFSEVLIWKPTKGEKKTFPVLKRLQEHNGVIFSVHYNEVSGYICSSSDDRSTVLWKVNLNSLSLALEQEVIDINVACRVSGHLSRVFRCQILNNCFITGGEDSLLCVWSFDGKLLRKIETHQGGPIWALDCDESNNFVLTGGGDCGATTFPIHSEFVERQFPLLNSEVPKAIGILASNNLVVISENGALYYIQKNCEKKCKEINIYEDLRSYSLLVTSNCKRSFALAGFYGQIYIYKEINSVLIRTNSFEAKIKTRIFSLHWLTCNTLLICQAEGKMTMLYLKKDKIHPITSFVLPPSKERWSTAAVSLKNYRLIVGDRKGNIHLFELGKVNAIQSIKRCHSHLGITNIIIEDDNEIIKSLGRNGIIRTFCIKNGKLHLLATEKLPFTWLVNIIDTLVLAFSGNSFIIWSYVAKRILFEKSCGGGHRSWDFLRYLDTTTFCYIKDKAIHTVDLKLNNFIPVDVIEGYHVKEINAIEVIKVFDKFLVISGSEDTTLRINVADTNTISNLTSLKSHLSSIRTITKHVINDKPGHGKNTYLLFSAGGRAQIICWKLSIFTQDGTFQNMHCSEQHSYYKPINSKESEMRIMDLTVTEISDNLVLFCACSDGNIKVFSIERNGERKYHLTYKKDIFYKLKCIIRIENICISFHNIIVTMATDGMLVFWDVTNIFSDKLKMKPIHKIQVHQSGINSCGIKLLQNDLCLFITGGDDNAITLTLVKISIQNGNIEIENMHTSVDTSTHCAQITGIFIGKDHFITASIDQRVAIFEWQVQNTSIIYKYITKYNTTVADVQGLACFESSNTDTFVYGKGIEYIKIKIK